MEDTKHLLCWQGSYKIDNGNSRYHGRKEVSFLLHINSNDENGGFEGIIEDDPDAYGIEMRSKVYGIWTKHEVRFVKILDKTYFLPFFGQMSGVRYANENYEVYYKAILHENGDYVGFWNANPTFRKLGATITDLEAVEGSWKMKHLE